MSNLRTTQDLLVDALRKAGEKTDGTSQYAGDALEYMNTNYKNILTGATMFELSLGEPWAWAKARYPLIIQLEVPYSAGSVALTLGSTAGLFSAPPAASMANRLLKLVSRPDYIRIASHTAGAPDFVIDAPYMDETITGSGFLAHKLDYEIGATGGGNDGILRLFAPMRVYRNQGTEADGTGLISELDQRTFAEKYPLRTLPDGTPTEYCVLHSDDGLIVLRFNKSVAVLTRVEIDQILVPVPLTDSSTSIPLIPEAHREVLSMCTAHDILVDKEDDKQQLFFNFAKAKLQAMMSAQRKARQNARRNFGRMIPRPDQTVRYPWRTKD